MNNLPTQLQTTEFSDLHVENLIKKIGDFILDAHFTVAAGERAILIGPSGSGKTTLLRILAGLEPLNSLGDQGKILLGSTEITHLPPQERKTAFIFQDPALFPSMNVLENVSFALKMQGISREERTVRADNWLEKVDLKSKKYSSVGNLSGGEKQRVAFVRALIWKPNLLLLDEPFSALDPKLREKLRKELLDLHQLWPVPLVLVTHDKTDIETVGTVCLNLSSDQNSPIRSIRKG
jgi:ABC-type Fe3+/spermidine/putrescine transport system ATPase subunit